MTNLKCEYDCYDSKEVCTADNHNWRIVSRACNVILNIIRNLIHLRAFSLEWNAAIPAPNTDLHFENYKLITWNQQIPESFKMICIMFAIFSGAVLDTIFIFFSSYRLILFKIRRLAAWWIFNFKSKIWI